MWLLSFWRGMPTLKQQMQPFRQSASVQEGTYFHTNIQVYRISSCQQFRHRHTSSVLSRFSGKKYLWHLNHFQWGRSRNNSRIYILSHVYFCIAHSKCWSLEFLAHLSWRLRMSYCDHSPSIRSSSIHSFERLLLWNPWANFLQTSCGAFC